MVNYTYDFRVKFYTTKSLISLSIFYSAAEKKHQDAVKEHIAIEDDELEVHAEELIAKQFNKGYNVHPIRKAKEKLALEARGCPVVVSLDGSKIRIQPQPKDIFYRPEQSRDRLSINWT